jgi:hypothetical protein
LAGLAGLKLHKVHSNQLSVSSLISYLFLGLFIHLRSFRTFKRMIRKASNPVEKEILEEQHALNINQTLLMHKHLCVTFQKK